MNEIKQSQKGWYFYITDGKKYQSRNKDALDRMLDGKEVKLTQDRRPGAEHLFYVENVEKNVEKKLMENKNLGEDSGNSKNVENVFDTNFLNATFVRDVSALVDKLRNT